MTASPHRPQTLRILEATWPQDLGTARRLITEYLASIAHTVCVGDAEAELTELDSRYAPPVGGVFLAEVDGQWAGCCAFRPLHDTDHSNACEMKRLYVRPAYRRMGLGYALAEAVRDAAQVAGYACLLLDTLTEMEAARALYEEMGFSPIPPYTQTPLPGAHHLRLDLV